MNKSKNGIFKRNCPLCKNEIKYKSYEGYKKGNEKNSLCRSCSKTGERNNFYGKRHSEKTCKIISQKVTENQLGKPLSKEHKLSLSKALTGRSFSKETLNKMSKSAIRRFSIPENNPMFGKKHSDKTRCKLRTIHMEQLKKINPNVRPMYNPNACKIIDEYGKKSGYNFQHAENNGEFYIKDLGYWVDGYDKEKNVVLEIDEKKHFDRNGNLKEKDVIRQKEIQSHLNCEFIRIKI